MRPYLDSDVPRCYSILAIAGNMCGHKDIAADATLNASIPNCNVMLKDDLFECVVSGDSALVA